MIRFLHLIKNQAWAGMTVAEKGNCISVELELNESVNTQKCA